MSKFSTSNKTFIQKRLNTIVMLAIVFTVLIAGYFVLRGVLVDDPATTTEPPKAEMMPGEATFGDSTLIIPYIERKNIKTVKVHNPANKTYGDEYVDWGIGFAYNEEAKDYYGYLLTYDYAVLDETQLSYFVIASGLVAFDDRVAMIDENTDLSVYGLEEDKAASMTLETRDGKTYTLYYGKKATNGSYYVRSGDTYLDENGNTVERNVIYLLNVNTTANSDMTILAKPTEMLTKLMTYPVKSQFTSFVLQDSWGDMAIAFLPTASSLKRKTMFGGSSIYYTVALDDHSKAGGYFSSSEFETLITIFENFTGDAVLEYATKKVEGVDEETGKSYTHYVFEDEILEKYDLDASSELRMLFYTAAVEGSEEGAASEVYFSALQPGGFYYAYSLNYGTILQVPASLVGFLEWDFLDFVDAYPFRISIGYIETLTVKGTIDGKHFSESFTSTVDSDYIVKSVKAHSTNEVVDLELYRQLCMTSYSTYLRGEVPEDLDIDALMQGEPYAEITLKTRAVTVYAADASGNASTKVEGIVESETRIFRFYRYSNERALITVESIDANGNSKGESGMFYVLTAHLDKYVRNAEKVILGIPFSSYDKE